MIDTEKQTDYLLATAKWLDAMEDMKIIPHNGAPPESRLPRQLLRAALRLDRLGGRFVILYKNVGEMNINSFETYKDLVAFVAGFTTRIWAFAAACDLDRPDRSLRPIVTVEFADELLGVKV